MRASWKAHLLGGLHLLPQYGVDAGTQLEPGLPDQVLAEHLASGSIRHQHLGVRTHPQDGSRVHLGEAGHLGQLRRLLGKQPLVLAPDSDVGAVHEDQVAGVGDDMGEEDAHPVALRFVGDPFTALQDDAAPELPRHARAQVDPRPAADLLMAQELPCRGVRHDDDAVAADPSHRARVLLGELCEQPERLGLLIVQVRRRAPSRGVDQHCYQRPVVLDPCGRGQHDVVPGRRTARQLGLGRGHLGGLLRHGRESAREPQQRVQVTSDRRVDPGQLGQPWVGVRHGAGRVQRDDRDR